VTRLIFLILLHNHLNKTAMSKKETITVQKTEIILLSHKKEDYISLTDMARYRNAEAMGYIISRWLSVRYTIDFIGIWEKVSNPDFNVV
jgi:hypothetical protein